MDISVQELKEKIDRGDSFVFIDVREQHEFDEFNLGAQLIPLGTLPTNLDEFSAHKQSEIVVHCRSGKRSGVARDFMTRAGFENVRNLTGGVLAWQEVYGAEI